MIPERITVKGKRVDNGEWTVGYLFFEYILPAENSFYESEYDSEEERYTTLAGVDCYKIDPETVEPVAVKVSVDDDNVLCCPNCKGRVMEFTEYTYCLFCGQRLDWGDCDDL